jgi:hypothetical protein
MAGPSTSRTFTEVEQVEYLREVLDESISEHSSDSDSDFDVDYTQLVTPGTHEISESGNDETETQEEIVQVELRRVSSKFVWEDIDTSIVSNPLSPSLSPASISQVPSKSRWGAWHRNLTSCSLPAQRELCTLSMPRT